MKSNGWNKRVIFWKYQYYPLHVRRWALGCSFPMSIATLQPGRDLLSITVISRPNFSLRFLINLPSLILLSPSAVSERILLSNAQLGVDLIRWWTRILIRPRPWLHGDTICIVPAMNQTPDKISLLILAILICSLHPLSASYVMMLKMIHHPIVDLIKPIKIKLFTG